MLVAKWGNSLAVRLPATVVEALELKEGDEIKIHIADAREIAVARKPGRDELLKRLRAFRGRLPADFKFDREERSPSLPYRGKVEAPIRNMSTERAHWRPSRMAQTTRDWPRRISPAANTLSSEVR
jgi:antitoxin MazE